MQSSAREPSIAHKMAECNALLRYFANVSAYSRVRRRITSLCSGYFSNSFFRSNSSNSSYLKQGETIQPTRLKPSSSMADPKIIPFGTSTCGTSPFSRSSRCEFSGLIDHINRQRIAVMIIPYLIRLQAMKMGHFPLCQHKINTAPQVPLFFFQQAFLEITALHMGLHFQMLYIIFR